MRKETNVVVFDKEQYDGEWPPEKATECVSWFAEKVASIPAEYRDTARIEIDSESGYEGSHYGHISITFRRPETDDEMVMRNNEEARTKRKKEERERNQLAELKAKYG